MIGIANEAFFDVNPPQKHKSEGLAETFENFRNLSIDIGDQQQIRPLFEEADSRLQVVIHHATQPSSNSAATNSSGLTQIPENP